MANTLLKSIHIYVLYNRKELHWRVVNWIQIHAILRLIKLFLFILILNDCWFGSVYDRFSPSGQLLYYRPSDEFANVVFDTMMQPKYLIFVWYSYRLRERTTMIGRAANSTLWNGKFEMFDPNGSGEYHTDVCMNSTRIRIKTEYSETKLKRVRFHLNYFLAEFDRKTKFAYLICLLLVFHGERKSQIIIKKIKIKSNQITP